MNRRQYLRLVAGTTTAGLLAGCNTRRERTDDESPTPEPTATPTPSGPSAPVTRHGVTFQTVLHAVEDLGMDPTGETPIDDALDEAYGDRTLVVFPPGQYLATKQHVWKQNVQGFGILGLGDRHTDVEFVFPRGNRQAADPANYWFLRAENGSHHHLENVTIQQSNDRVTGVGMVFYQSDGLHIEDVELAGFNPAWSHDPGFGLIAAITDRDGVGTIRRFTSVGGGVVDVYPKRKTPIGSFENHRGELRILEPHIEESGSHSLYVSRTNGCVRVEDGYFRNNDNTNLRMSGGGHPSKRSWAKNCRIVIDTDAATRLPDGESYEGARGFWVEAGNTGPEQFGHTDLLVEDLSIVARSNAKPLALLLVDHNHGSVTVRNASIRSSVPGSMPVDVRSVDTRIVRRPYGVTLDAVSVYADVPRTTEEFAIRIDGRPDSLLRDVTVDVLSGAVGGIAITESPGIEVLDTRVTTHLADWQRVPGDEEPVGTNPGLLIVNSENYVIQNSVFAVPGRRKRIVTEPSD